MKASALCIAVALFASPLARAQDRAVVSLTLDQATARGLEASHRVADATARRDQAQAMIDERRALGAPQVTVLGGYTRTNHVQEFGVLLPTNQLRVIYPDVPDNYRARLDVQLPIYTGGRVAALTEAARFETAAASDDIDVTRADLTFDIARTFWTLVVSTESVRVVNESLARTTAHLRDVRNQLDAGLVPPNEVATAAAQEARQRMLSIQAGSAREVAEAELARLTGLAPGTPIRAEATLDPVASDREAEPLITRALAARRDRQALVDRLSAATARGQAALAGRRPTIGVGGGVDYANPNPRIFPREDAWKNSWDASVNVSWSLFDGGRARAEVAEMSASQRALQARLEEFDSVVGLDVRQRLAEIVSSHAAVEAADAQIGAATEARRVVGDRFAAGVATSTEVLDAQVALLQASLDRVQAIINGRIAEARLQRAIGQ